MSAERVEIGNATLWHGDCLAAMAELCREGVLVDAVVTDPPYHLIQWSRGGSPRQNNPVMPFGRAEARGGFVGQRWDGGDIAFRPETWAAMLPLLRPGGFLLAFGGTRTAHRMVCAIEDAGFEIRDTIVYLYGSGFPKSYNVNKALGDRVCTCNHPLRGMREAAQNANGLAQESQSPGRWPHCGRCGKPIVPSGQGTALKPAIELICIARKPLIGNVAENFLRHSTGTLQIDECRVDGRRTFNASPGARGYRSEQHSGGRWPANLCHDGSDEVMAAFAKFRAPGQSGIVTGHEPSPTTRNVLGPYGERASAIPRGDSGSAARFFYCAKASKEERAGSRHPTVKPQALMRWLVALVTPPGGTVLDPFAGSGTTGVAAIETGRNAILIEREAEYIADIRRRLQAAQRQGRFQIEAAMPPKDRTTTTEGAGDLLAALR